MLKDMGAIQRNATTILGGQPGRDCPGAECWLSRSDEARRHSPPLHQTERGTGNGLGLGRVRRHQEPVGGHPDQGARKHNAQGPPHRERHPGQGHRAVTVSGLLKWHVPCTVHEVGPQERFTTNRSLIGLSTFGGCKVPHKPTQEENKEGTREVDRRRDLNDR
ncbi:unnamed protein product [Phytophthora fragariaefolia]|uniref:Unnamed protein product n=1 Tax=Phytophthora fragariaefolia TaxID=1490495 RepID=A0A9W6Y1B3_9STRA|nr:unnamed protein product [Phytophthora fragariaefolia]